jgi:hypothetical protein
MESQALNNVSFEGEVRLITGLFADHDVAEAAYTALMEKGYSREEISLVMSDDTRNKYFPSDTVLKDPAIAVKDPASIVLEDAAVGTAIGGSIGAVIAAIAAIGTSVVIPGFGVVIAGPIAAGLAGAGAGGIAGSILGALEGAGIAENRAKLERKLEKGYIIIGFHPHSKEDARHFEQAWREFR